MVPYIVCLLVIRNHVPAHLIHYGELLQDRFRTMTDSVRILRFCFVVRTTDVKIFKRILEHSSSLAADAPWWRVPHDQSRESIPGPEVTEDPSLPALFLCVPSLCYLANNGGR